MLEDEVLQERARHVLVQRQGVGGKLLPAQRAGLDKLVVEVVHRLHYADAEADDRVAVLARHGHHLVRAEGLAVHDEALHHLGHDLPLGAVEYVLLLTGEFHLASLLCISVVVNTPRFGTRPAAGPGTPHRGVNIQNNPLS